MSIQSSGSSSRRELDEFCTDSGELERAGAVQREFKMEKNFSDTRILFAQSALRVKRTDEKKGVQKMT